MKSLGDTLVKLRGDKSQNEVASALGVSVSALSMYENNQRVPRDGIKMKMAEYYKKTVQEIFYSQNIHLK